MPRQEMNSVMLMHNYLLNHSWLLALRYYCCYSGKVMLDSAMQIQEAFL